MEPVPPWKSRASTAVTRHQSGRWAEQQARRWLTDQGLCFVAANKRYRGGELDLIMRDGRRWIFVEVRYRRNDKFGSAAATVTRLKQRRVRHAAGCWLTEQGINPDNAICRFDVVAITDCRVQWLRNAFTAEM